MITANIQFLQNSLVADLSCLPIKLHEDLQRMGVLTPQDLIRLDNARTLKIQLYPEDNYGEQLMYLIDTKHDTLGEVNTLCHSIKCMDNRDKARFFDNLDMEKYRDLSSAQNDVDKMRTQRRRKMSERSR